MGERYTYVVVRGDLEKNHQMPQACHAALESGRSFPNPVKSDTYIVVLTVSDEKELLELENKVNQSGVRTEKFFEPDWNYGWTSFATEPIGQNQRMLFSHLDLWRI